MHVCLDAGGRCVHKLELFISQATFYPRAFLPHRKDKSKIVREEMRAKELWKSVVGHGVHGSCEVYVCACICACICACVLFNFTHLKIIIEHNHQIYRSAVSKFANAHFTNLNQVINIIHLQIAKVKRFFVNNSQ